MNKAWFFYILKVSLLLTFQTIGANCSERPLIPFQDHKLIENENKEQTSVREKNKDEKKLLHTHCPVSRYCPRGPKGKQGAPGSVFENYLSSFNTNSISTTGNLLFEVPLTSENIDYNSMTGIFSINNEGVYSLTVNSQFLVNQDPFEDLFPNFSFFINNQLTGVSPFFLPSSGFSVIQKLFPGDTIRIQVLPFQILPKSFNSCISLTIVQIN